jgi:DNA-binding NarL/FixJ family response regulator
MNDPIRTLIVDDHQLLAEALALALSRIRDVQVVGVALSVAEATRLASETNPRVILADYHLPDGTLTTLARDLHERAPNAALVVLTGDSSQPVLLNAVEAGAAGLILKSVGVTALADAIRRAASGDLLFSAVDIARLIGLQRDRTIRDRARQDLRDQLTPRERDVLRLMAEGLDTRAIAERLVVSYTTVRGYVQDLLTKLGAHSRLEAVARARTQGLLDE